MVATGTVVEGYVHDAGVYPPRRDTLGRREKVTSYSDNACTTAVNEVLYTYNDLGALDSEYQEHDGEKDAETLYVQYNYDDTASGGEYTKAMRLKSVRYPDTRLVHYLYVDSGGGSGVGDKISRVTAISAAATRPDETDVYSAYSYNGAGRTVLEDYPQPDVRLDYWGQAADTYAGFDRFGISVGRPAFARWVSAFALPASPSFRLRLGPSGFGSRLRRDEPP